MPPFASAQGPTSVEGKLGTVAGRLGMVDGKIGTLDREVPAPRDGAEPLRAEV